MKELEIKVRKVDVYNEVSKTTSYEGAAEQDADAYDRVRTTDAENEILERFWNDSCDNVTALLAPYIINSPGPVLGGRMDIGSDFTAVVRMSDWFDENLIPSLNSLLCNYFVNDIVSSWFGIVLKSNIKIYELKSAALATQISQLLKSRKRPELKHNENEGNNAQPVEKRTGV